MSVGDPQQQQAAQQQIDMLKHMLAEVRAENDRLRAEVAEAKENWCPKAERDNALNRVTRLRKALNWMRGCFDRESWEYKRATAVLDEEAE